MKDISEEVRISFWEKHNDNTLEASELLYCYTSVYPNYKEGDIIFLDKEVMHDVHEKFQEPRLRGKYVITDVHHSAKKIIYNNDKPNAENPTPIKIMNFISVEVYVTPHESEIEYRKLCEETEQRDND